MNFNLFGFALPVLWFLAGIVTVSRIEQSRWKEIRGARREWLNLAAVFAAPVVLIVYAIDGSVRRRSAAKAEAAELAPERSVKLYDFNGTPFNTDEHRFLAPQQLCKELFARAAAENSERLCLQPSADDSALIRLERNGKSDIVARLSGADALHFAALLKTLAGCVPGVNRGSFRGVTNDGELRGKLECQEGPDGEKLVLNFIDKAESPTLLALGMPESVRQKLLRAQCAAGLTLLCLPEGPGSDAIFNATLGELVNGGNTIFTLQPPGSTPVDGVSLLEFTPGDQPDAAELLDAAVRRAPDLFGMAPLADAASAQAVIRQAQRMPFLAVVHQEEFGNTIRQFSAWGVAPQELAGVLRLLVTVRHVPELCPSCARTVKLSAELADQYASEGLATDRARNARGCRHCGNTGRNGDVPIFDLLSIDRELRGSLAGAGDDAEEAAARLTAAHGPEFLLLAARRLAAEGVVSAADVEDQFNGKEASQC